MDYKLTYSGKDTSVVFGTYCDASVKEITRGRGLESSSQSTELKDSRTEIYSLNKLYTVM